MEKIIPKLRKGVIGLSVALVITVGVSTSYIIDMNKLNEELVKVNTDNTIEIDRMEKSIDVLNDEVYLLNGLNEALEERNKKVLDAVKKEKELRIKAEQERIEANAKAEVEKVKAEAKKKETVVSRNDSVQSKATVYEATAYTAYCRGCSGVTTTGENVRDSIYYKGYRIIAVDTSKIPLYSIVRVEYGDTSFEAIALDTGGAIKGYKIDLLVDSYNKATDFGRQKVSITVLSNGKK